MRKPFKHQTDAINFGLTPEGHMLALDMGLGKTSVAIWIAQRMGAEKVMVACPSILTSNWIREFALVGWKGSIADTSRPKGRKIATSVDSLVFSVDWMRQSQAKDLAKGHWDLAIVDEGHFLANPESARTQATYSPDIRADKTLILTGTPAPKHAGQLWTHINRTAPERIDYMTYEQFTNRYCVTEMKKFGGMQFAQPMITGNQRLQIPDLRKRLDGWWLRQKKEDVLDLPPKLIKEVMVPASRADLRAIENEVDPEVYEYVQFMLDSGDMSGFDALTTMVATLRRLLAKAKVKPTVDYVLGLREIEPRQVSVWGWHTEALHGVENALLAKGLRVGLIDGKTHGRGREEIVDRFQSGDLDVFIGQIKAAGVGITLTSGNRAVFMEESFNPADNAQAADRHHRIGQKDTVYIERLILENTIDEAVAAIVAKRQEQWEELGEKR